MGNPIIFIILALFFAAIIYGYFFSKKAIVKRKLKKAGWRKIQNIKNGEIAKIIGKVKIIDSPLIAPLSYRECAYYYIKVEEKSSGKNKSWSTILEEEKANPVLFHEDGIYALINDNNVKSYIVQDKNYSSGIFNDANANLENYLISKGMKSEGFFGMNKSLRYKEGVLEHGEKIAVYGRGEWKEASTLGLAEEYGKVLEITSSKDEAVYLSDDPDTTVKKMFNEKPKANKKKREGRYRKE